MGWTTTFKPKEISASDYMLNQSGVFSWGPDSPATYKVLDSAIVEMKTMYAAVERIDKATGARIVWAAVILLDYWKDQRENFGWKSMDESMGPVESRCPERILNLLTDTDSDYAKEWRARCRAYHAARKAKPTVVPGATVVLYGKRYLITGRHTSASWRATMGGTVYKISDAKIRNDATEIVLPGAAPAPTAPETTAPAPATEARQMGLFPAEKST